MKAVIRMYAGMDVARRILQPSSGPATSPLVEETTTDVTMHQRYWPCKHLVAGLVEDAAKSGTG